MGSNSVALRAFQSFKAAVVDAANVVEQVKSSLLAVASIDGEGGDSEAALDEGQTFCSRRQIRLRVEPSVYSKATYFLSDGEQAPRWSGEPSEQMGSV